MFISFNAALAWGGRIAIRREFVAVRPHGGLAVPAAALETEDAALSL
jgi:hypothetical protein